MHAMASFSQRKLARRTPAGPEVPEGVRRTLLEFARDLGVDHREVWRELRRLHGWGTPRDVVEDVQERFSRASAERAAGLFEREMQVRRVAPKNDPDRYAMPGLLGVPTPFFLDALELTVALAEKEYTQHFDGIVDSYSSNGPPLIAEINRIFEVRTIHFRFTERGTAEWHGDPGAYEQVVAPALAVLDDPRLALARTEFQDGLAGLRRGDRVGVKNAIRDASNAVETAMKALLDESGSERPGKETADPLWEALHDAGVVAAKTKDVICAASRLRNSYGGHGPDPSLGTPVPEGIAELSVHSAAAALIYLARQLP